MPQLFTNTERKPVKPTTGDPNKFCVSSYEEYAAQRVKLSDISTENIDQLTTAFKERISIPLGTINKNLEMGEYFVIPVSEIREMINSCSDIKFIHVCNALRDTINSNGEIKSFPVTILVPIIKLTTDNKSHYEICADANSIFVESYPCPPDPRCPQQNELIGTVLENNASINNFNSLF